MTKDERAELIDKLIRMVWSSLESHLEWTHEKSDEGQKFHRECVREYSEMLKLIAELY